MELRTKLEDIGIDTDEKEMYELAKFIWKEAQKEIKNDVDKKLYSLLDRVFYIPVLKLEWKQKIQEILNDEFKDFNKKE